MDAIKGKIIIKILFSSLISAFIFFAAGEIILRLSHFGNYPENEKKPELLFKMGSPLMPVDPTVDQRYQRDSKLFWKLRPNRHEEVNVKGYRGILREYAKPPGLYRIIIIGDSCAYGVLVPYQDTYSFILEQKLNAMNRGDFEVINAGVPGYSSLQGMHYLEYELLKYNPDLVLAAFGFNDLVEAVNTKDKEIERPPSWLISFDNMLSKTRTYSLLKRMVFGIRYQLIAGLAHRRSPALEDFSGQSFDSIADSETLIRVQEWQLSAWPLRRVPPRDFADNIKEIIRLGGKNKFKIFLLTMPSINGCFGYGKLLNLLAKENDVGIIDLIGEFEQGGANTQDYFIDNNHYNRKGHELVADIIFNRLADLSPDKNQ